MDRTKKIILFVIGLYIIPIITAFLTAFIFKIDIFEHALFECLCFDYIIAYIFTPLLYKEKIRKYIQKEYMFFALFFFLFWFWEICRINFFC